MCFSIFNKNLEIIRDPCLSSESRQKDNPPERQSTAAVIVLWGQGPLDGTHHPCMPSCHLFGFSLHRRLSNVAYFVNVILVSIL